MLTVLPGMLSPSILITDPCVHWIRSLQVLEHWSPKVALWSAHHPPTTRLSNRLWAAGVAEQSGGTVTLGNLGTVSFQGRGDGALHPEQPLFLLPFSDTWLSSKETSFLWRHRQGAPEVQKRQGACPPSRSSWRQSSVWPTQRSGYNPLLSACPGGGRKGSEGRLRARGAVWRGGQQCAGSRLGRGLQGAGGLTCSRFQWYKYSH